MARKRRYTSSKPTPNNIQKSTDYNWKRAGNADDALDLTTNSSSSSAFQKASDYNWKRASNADDAYDLTVNDTNDDYVFYAPLPQRETTQKNLQNSMTQAEIDAKSEQLRLQDQKKSRDEAMKRLSGTSPTLSDGRPNPEYINAGVHALKYYIQDWLDKGKKDKRTPQQEQKYATAQLNNLTAEQRKSLQDYNNNEASLQSLQTSNAWTGNVGGNFKMENDLNTANTKIRQSFLDSGMSQSDFDKLRQYAQETSDAATRSEFQNQIKKDTSVSYAKKQAEKKLANVDDDTRNLLDTYNENEDKIKAYQVQGASFASNRNIIDLMQQNQQIQKQIQQNTKVSDKDFDKLTKTAKTAKTGDAARKNLNSALYTAGDILTSPAQGFGSVKEWLDSYQYADKKAPVNTNSSDYAMTNLGTDIENQVNKNIGDKHKVGQFLYGAGVSTGKSAMNMLMGAGVGEAASAAGMGEKGVRIMQNLATLPQFGASSFGQTLQEQQDKGVGENRAIASALVSGAAEMGTEVFSLDHFWDMSKAKGANLLKDWIVQSGIEGSEEVAGDAINDIADQIIYGSKSDYNKMVYDLRAQGKSEKEAKQTATVAIVSEAVKDGLAGTMSGAVMGGVGTAMSVNRANELLKDENYSELAEGLEDEKASKIAGELADKQKKGKKVTSNDRARLQNAIDDALPEQIKERGGSDLRYEYDPTQVHENDNEGNEIQIPQQYRAQPARNLNNIPSEMFRAQTPEQLVSLRDAANEAAQNDAQRQMVDRAYAQNTGRMLSQGIATQDDITNAENATTPARAYAMGVRNENLSDADKQNTRLTEAYNTGRQNYLTRQATRTISGNVMDVQAQDKTTGNPVKMTDIQINHTGGRGSAEYTPTITIEENGEQRQVSPDQVNIADGAAQTLINRAADQQTTELAQLYVHSIPKSMTVGQYNDVFNRIRDNGDMGDKTFDEILPSMEYAIGKGDGKIPVETARNIYNAGAMARGITYEARDKSFNMLAKAGTGTYQDQRQNAGGSLDNYLADAYKVVAKETGMDIILSDNTNYKGNPTYSNSDYAIPASANAAYQDALNRVIVNAYAGNAEKFTAIGHEVGEFAQANAPQESEEFWTMAMDYLTKSMGRSKLEDRVRDVARRYGSNLKEASEEVTNNMVSMIVTKKGLNEDFVNDSFDKAKTEDEVKHVGNVFTKMLDYIKGIGDHIRSFLQSHIKSMTPEEQAVYKADAEDIDKLYNSAMKMVTAARENAQKRVAPGAEVNAEENAPKTETKAEEKAEPEVKAEEKQEEEPKTEEKSEPSEEDTGTVPRSEAKKRSKFSKTKLGRRIEFHKALKKQFSNRFSLKETVEQTKDLIAVHNLTEKELLGDLNLGGMPSPSIAIIKTSMEHNKYGDISVLFNREAIDPQSNRTNKVYGGDAYTPVFPRIEYDLNRKKLSSVSDSIKNLVPENIRSALGNTALDYENATDRINDNAGDVYDAFGDNKTIQYAFLKDTGASLETPMKEAQYSRSFENDEVKAVADTLTDDQIKEMQDEGYAWAKEHPDEVEQIRNKLNETFRNRVFPNGKPSDDAPAFKKRLYNEDIYKDLPFSKFDNLVSGMAMYKLSGNNTAVDGTALSDEIDSAMSGKTDEYKKWLNKKFDGLIAGRGIRNNKDTFTSNDNRRSFRSLHDDVTLENIVKAMNRDEDTGSDSATGFNKFAASAQKNYRSISEIHSDESRLRMISDDDMDNLRKTYSDEFNSIVESIEKGNGFNAEDAAVDSLSDAIKGNASVATIQRRLSKDSSWLNLQPNTAQRVYNLAQKIANIPTGYFEAKPKRATYLNEIREVVLPDNSSQELKAALSENNIPYAEYKAGDNESRKAVLNSFDDARFSLSENRNLDLSNTSSVQWDNAMKNRYSLEDDSFFDIFSGEEDEDALDAFEGEEDAAPHALMEDSISKMEDVLAASNNALHGVPVSDETISGIADDILKQYKSDYSAEDLKTNLHNFFDYMQNHNQIDYNDMLKVLTEISKPVVEQTRETDPVAQKTYDDFIDTVKKTSIYLSQQERDNVASQYGSYTKFKNLYRGRISLATSSEKGTPIDTVWPDLVAASNGTLSLDTSDMDMPVQLANAIDMLKPTPGTSNGTTLDEESYYAGMSILQKYYDAEVDAIASETMQQTLKDKADAPRIKKALMQNSQNMRRQLNEFKTKAKEEYQQAVEANKAELDRIQKANVQLTQQNMQLARDAGDLKRYKEENARLKKLQSSGSNLSKAQVMALQRDSVSKYVNHQQTIKEKKEITRIANELVNRIENPTTKKHIPQAMQRPIGEFINSIDFISHRAKADSNPTLRWELKMHKLSDILTGMDRQEGSEAAKTGDDLMAMSYIVDPSLGDSINDFINKHSGEKISRMDAPSLHELTQIMRSLRATVNNANSAFMNKQYQQMDQLGSHTVGDMRKMPTKRQAMPHFVDKLLNVDMLDSFTWAEEIGPSAVSVQREFVEANNTRVRSINEAAEAMNKAMQKVDENGKPVLDKHGNPIRVDTSKWSGPNAEIISFPGIGHQYENHKDVLRMTPGQIMNLYELWKRKQAKPHILSGGIKVETTKYNRSDIPQNATLKDRLFNVRDRFIGKQRIQNYAIHLTESDLQTIFSKLTPEQIRVADAMQQFMANETSKWGNEVTMRMYGYQKFTDPNYFPIRTDSNTHASNDRNSVTASLQNIRNISASKDITPNASNAVIIGDAFDVFSDHIKDMATYRGYTMPMADALRWINYRTQTKDPNTGELITSSVKDEMDRVKGRDYQKYFINLLMDINGQTSKGQGGEISEALISNYKGAAIGGNLRVAIQQPTAYARASLMIDNKYLAKAMTLNVKKVVDYAHEAQEKSPIASWKSNGYFDTSLGQSIKSIVTGQQTFGEKLREKTSIAAQWGDDLTWGVLWHAVQLETEDKTKLKPGTAEFDSAVADRFDDIINHTQVVDTILHRSQFMRSQNTLVKMEAAFQAEPTKSYNMIHRALTRFNQNKTKENFKYLMKTGRVYFVTALLTSIVASIADAFRNDDDVSSWWDRYLEALKGNVIDNGNPIGLIPYVKDIISLANGYSIDRMDTQGISNMFQSVTDIQKYFAGSGTKTGYGVAKSAARGLSQVTGIPVYNIWREVESIHNAFLPNWRTSTQLGADVYVPMDKAISGDGNVNDTTKNLIKKKAENSEKYNGKSAKEANKSATTSVRSHITSTYKPQMISVYRQARKTGNYKEANALKSKIIEAMMATGLTSDEANKRINKWLEG